MWLTIHFLYNNISVRKNTDIHNQTWESYVQIKERRLSSEKEGCLKSPLKGLGRGAPGWLSWLNVWLLILAQVMISQTWDQAPRWALHCVWTLIKILSPSPHLHMLSLNKYHPPSIKEMESIINNLTKPKARPRWIHWWIIPFKK